MNRYAIIPCTVALCLTSLSATAVQLIAHEQYGVGSQPRTIASADFDQQNGADIVTANIGDDTLSILANNGDGTFASPATSLTVGDGAAASNYPSDIAIADFNGDALPDLAVTHRDSNFLSLLLNQGVAGSFSFNTIELDLTAVSQGDKPIALSSGLFNGDDFADLAIAYRSASLDPTISVLLGNGDGTFQVTDLGAGLTPSDIVSGDFDNDGNLDLIVANKGDASLSFYSGGGDGSFTRYDYDSSDSGQTDLSLGFTPVKLLAADFDGDGDLDLAATQLNDGADTSRVHILLGGGDATFATDSAPQYSVGVTPSALVSHDFDGDGQPDLAVTSLDSNSLLILHGLGGGHFALSEHFYAAGSGPIDLTRDDFDGDGYQDLAVAANSSDKVGVLPGRSDGRFHAALSRPIKTDNKTLLATDLNGDGLGDMVQLEPGTDSFSVRLRKSPHTFEPTVTYPALDNRPIGLATGRFNADEQYDLALIYDKQSQARIFLADENGSLSAAGTYELVTTPTTEPSAIASADFNNDGHTDLAVSSISASEILLIPGLGDGTFGDTLLRTTGKRPVQLVTHDINEDGLTDLATLNETYDSLSVTLNEGNLLFKNPLNYPMEGDIRALLGGDYDRDGVADFMVSYRDSHDLKIFTGNLNGTVDRGKEFVVGQFSHRLTSGDFNGDQIPDIAATITDSTSVMFLYGNGDGTFLPGVNISLGGQAIPDDILALDGNGDGISELIVIDDFVGEAYLLDSLNGVSYGLRDSFRTANSVGNNTGEVISLDFNLDGIPDLAVANTSRNNVGLLAGRGDGNYADAFVTNESAALPDAGPVSLASADFNGDGYPDIATANNASDDVSIFLSDGAGGYQEGFRLNLADGSSQPEVIRTGDFNNDGQADLVVTSPADNTLSLILADRSLSSGFQPAIAFPTPALDDPSDISAVDLDQDGDDDLVITNRGSAELIILANDGVAGSVGFTPQGQNYGVGVAPGHHQIVDLNMDGGADIVSTGRELGVILNEGRFMPDAFTIAPVTDAPISTPGVDPVIVTIGGVVTTVEAGVPAVNEYALSAPITISGLGAGNRARVAVEEGDYSLDGGASFTNQAGSVADGDSVIVRHPTASSAATTSYATLIVGGYSERFYVTTVDDGTKPDAFAFTPVEDAELASYIDSDPVTLSGLSAPARISISGGWYAINGGDFTAAIGEVNNNDTVVARVLTLAEPDGYEQTSTASVTVGGVSADFVVTTKSDINPDPFIFQDIIGVKPSTQYYAGNWLQISGFSAPAPISIKTEYVEPHDDEPVPAKYAIIADPTRYTDQDGILYPYQNNGQKQKIRISVVSPRYFGTAIRVTVTIGEVSSSFLVETRADPNDSGDALSDAARGIQEQSLFGCSARSRQGDLIDPTLPLLVLAAALALWRRRTLYR